MKQFKLLAGLLGLALGIALTGCNKPAGDEASQPAAQAGTSQVAATPPVTVDASAEICSGCGKPESECTCSEGAEHAAEGKEPAPAEVKLADGTIAQVVPVAKLNADPKAFKGVYAIDGTVGEVFADKGSFMLVDCDTAAACSDPGCASCAADMKLPVRVDPATLQGALPAARERVLVVAEVSPTTTGGFELKVREIRDGDKTVLTVGAPASKA